MKTVIEQMFPGWALSAVVGALLLYLIAPRVVVSILDRGRQFAGWTVAVSTLTTLWRYFDPAPKGGGEAIAGWLAVTIPLGLVAFMVGAAFQAALQGARKVRKDGPEMLGSAIKKSTDIAQRVQVAVKTHAASAQGVQLQCANCQTVAEAKAIFCQNCGSHLPKNPTCTDCGAQLATEQKFCDKCGQPCSKNKE